LSTLPPLPASTQDAGWRTVDCQNSFQPPSASAARGKILLDGCTTDQIRQTTAVLAQQAPGVTDLWIRSLTLSQQSSHGPGSLGRKLPPSAGCRLPRLTSLKISRTAFGPASMAADLATWLACDTLEVVDLSQNSGQLLVAGGPQLRLLNMSSSQLSELSEAAAFQQLEQLRVLDLSHNHLVKLPGGIWTRNQQLTHLHLQHNHISAISRQSFLGRWRDVVKAGFPILGKLA
jgi:Leucine-rich repeat (LRR) protein